MFEKDRLIFLVVLFQILFERCSKCFQDILQKFENFGSKVCNNLHLETEHFWLELELSLISKQNLKRKGLSWFQKCISKRSLPKWFERVENYLIWFNSPKVLFQKELEHVYWVFCLTSKENGNWKLTLFISKVVLKLIWFGFRNPKRVQSKWFENEVECFIYFLKSWKSLVWNRFQKNLSWFVCSLSEIWL